MIGTLLGLGAAALLEGVIGSNRSSSSYSTTDDPASDFDEERWNNLINKLCVSLDNEEYEKADSQLRNYYRQFENNVKDYWFYYYRACIYLRKLEETGSEHGSLKRSLKEMRKFSIDDEQEEEIIQLEERYQDALDNIYELVNNDLSDSQDTYVRSLDDAQSLDKIISKNFIMEHETQSQTTPNNNMAFNTKADIEGKYHELIDYLECTSMNIKGLRSSNCEFTKMRNELVDKVQHLIEQIKNETRFSLNAISWDNLVIAFFGETNAGKSTIIETFRILFENNRKKNSDGEIVGDGRTDFTKEYHEYKLEINKKKFTLIDVPGIEGNEKEYKDGIEEALRRAHCVFYVQAHNKKPDEATASKIKDYLGDWVSVYSIQNVRGGVSNYDEEEERKTLLSPVVLKNENLIKETFTKILGQEVYKGHITLQALLAMCAKASFSSRREDLQGYQSKLLNYFGNSDQILRFSQFQTVINLVDSKSKDFLNEITESNKQKMVSFARKVSREIEMLLDEQEEQNDELRKSLNEYRRFAITTMGNANNKLNSQLSNLVNSEISTLKQKIFEILDSDMSKDSKKEEISRNTKSFPTKLSRSISKSIKDILNQINQKVKIKGEKLDGISQFKGISLPNLSLNIDYDLSSELEDLDINLDDVGNFLLTTGGSAGTGAAIGSLVGPVGTAVGACVGFLIGSIGSAVCSDGGKGEAKKDISRKMAQIAQETIIAVSNKITSITRDINSQKMRMVNSVDNLIKDLDEMDESFENLKSEINSYINNIKLSEYGRI